MSIGVTDSIILFALMAQEAFRIDNLIAVLVDLHVMAVAQSRARTKERKRARSARGR